MKIVYDEQYGELSYMQRAAYRKFNVSPSDHNSLVHVYGDDHKAIEQAVRENSPHGFFSFWAWAKD